MKNLFAAIGIIIAFVSYIPYFKDMRAGKTKPHAFTWFIWFLLTVIAFFAQLESGGGVGSWILGFTAGVALFIFLAALKIGRKNIEKIDWLFLAGSLAALGLWFVTDDPTWSVILITLIDALAFAPTFRKAYKDPYSETLITFLLSGIKFIFAIAALETYNTATVLYPVSLVLMNGLFVILLVVRRAKIPEKKTT